MSVSRLLMLPWLMVRMVEMILAGGPLVILTDLLALHLSLEGLLLPGLLVTSLPPLVTILLMSVWCLVLATYVRLGQADRSRQGEGRAEEGVGVEAVGRPHQARHSQYTQFYKPRHAHARPHQPEDTVNLYPTLPPLAQPQ